MARLNVTRPASLDAGVGWLLGIGTLYICHALYIAINISGCFRRWGPASSFSARGDNRFEVKRKDIGLAYCRRLVGTVDWVGIDDHSLGTVSDDRGETVVNVFAVAQLDGLQR